MRLIVHKMHGCKICHKCIRLLKYWGIRYRSVYDKPIKRRPYPYITIELEYEELVDWIAMEKIK